MIEIRHIEEKDQRQLANIIRSIFEEYNAPLVNTVYDDPRTEHIFDTLTGHNAEYCVIVENDNVLGGCGFYPTEGLPEGYAELVKFYLSPEARGLGYGSKLLTGEKTTRNRDLILRICYAAEFTLDETQRALRLYPFDTLYARNKRDALIMVCFNKRPGDIFELNELLNSQGIEPLHGTEKA